MKYIFVDESWEDYLYWQQTNKKIVDKINKASCNRFSRPSMMKHLLLLFAISISLTLNAQTNMVQSPRVTKSPGGETQKNAGYSYTIIPSVDKTWGYDIYLQKRLFIHQPSIPGLPGNKGFKTKTDTKKVARLVIGKIKKGEMPPNVTVEEMKKIKVL